MTTRTTFEDRLLAELRGEVERREAAGAPAREGTRAAKWGPAEPGGTRRDARRDARQVARRGARRGALRRRATGPSAVGQRDTGRDHPDAAGGSVGTVAPYRRLFTGRRLALAAGACAVAGLAVVLVPGSPAGSPAYAVERHGDGTVTFSLLKTGIGPEAQDGLAERLRADGIHVTIDDLPYGQQCAQPRGELLSSRMARAHIGDVPPEGSSAPVGGPSDPELRRQWEVTLRPGDSLAIENLARRDGEGTPGELFYAVKGKIAPCAPESVR